MKCYAKEDITSHTKPKHYYAKKGEELLIINDKEHPIAVKTLSGDMFYCSQDKLIKK